MRRTTAALIAALLIMFGPGASNAGAYSNGQLPESALSPASTGVRCDKPLGQFSNEAAAAYNSMALAAGKKLPTNGCSSAYRPLSIQQEFWLLYITGRGNLAAVPGTSNHGWGTAGDEATWVQGYIHLHGRRFCWAKTEAFSESWHYNYIPGCWRRPNPGVNLHSPTLRRHSGGPGQNIYVRKLQKLLRGHGDKTVDVNGSFEWKTARAVRRFQKAQRLKVNGVVSPRVWKRLRQPISKPVKTTPKKVPHVAGGTTAPPAKPTKPHKPKPPKKHHHRKPKGPAWGIDISSNNGAVNFKAVRRDGASFVITKATEGNDYVNPHFGRAQVQAIGAAGLVPGVYHYLRPKPGRSGSAEAAFFAQAIGRAGYGKGFMQPVVDLEETELSQAGTCRYLGQFVHTVKKVLGEKPIIYTFPSFVPDHLGGSSCRFLNHYLLWIAHPGASKPLIPSPWNTYAMWQYTWTGKVAGVTGGVDVNKVRGGRAALAKLRVRDVPRRVRKAPRAKLELPLEAEPRPTLRKVAKAGRG
ncbi:MAG TPA: GH25 family lysozyme [Solirubrobacterales bacterium]|nr:GH25 family lysozyme [Solirubrobacterales bacterium]